ncbi:MAG: class I SAM-dependent methyltransferase [Candidatus Taylorbacteria bacterium]|nr:class I SAM-dependent methyltransferase [Candidatus Taylorbacteria bacterium]
MPRKIKKTDIQSRALEKLYRVARNCRMCKSPNLALYLDLGLTPPADQFRATDELDLPEIFYPLRVLLCKNCGLSQLSHVVDPRILYQHDYPYEQSTTKTGQSHWDSFAHSVVSELKLKPKSLVVDIGSNVGTLLGAFKKEGMRVVGVDPAPNIVSIANKENGIKTLCDFFGMKSAGKIRRAEGPASVVVGANVFAHIDDLDEVIRAVKYLLKKDGVFIFESPYFQHLVDNLEYDTVYHEHLSYLSLKPLVPFFARFGLAVFTVKQTDIHGGSFRVFVGRKDAHPIDPSVLKFIRMEESRKLHSLETMRGFARRVEKNRQELIALLEKLLSQGKTVAAVSAPAKGMTLINYVGLTNRHIRFISEKARLKVGRVAPGGHAGGYIRVVSDLALLKNRPDYAILLAWNFSKEIIDNLKVFSDNGGKFIIPIPKPRIVDAKEYKKNDSQKNKK